MIVGRERSVAGRATRARPADPYSSLGLAGSASGRRVDVVGDLAVPVVERRAEGRRADDGDEAHERGEQRVSIKSCPCSSFTRRATRFFMLFIWSSP